MSALLKSPPLSPSHLTSGEELAKRLQVLVGTQFQLAPGNNKARTDGSNLRKRVARVLEGTQLPAEASPENYKLLPPKAKGVTRLRREWLDTFIVTTGKSYNLQVWNRNPSEPMPQIEYSDGQVLRANDIRFALIRVDPVKNIIRSVIVATPNYIVEHFGKFGKQTVKEQLIITNSCRAEILARQNSILFYPDEPTTPTAGNLPVDLKDCSIRDKPNSKKVIPLTTIKEFVVKNLIGREIKSGSTKNRGQALESLVAEGLGYNVKKGELLVGGYPDLRHQILEVKIQDAATVDLGKYSPQFEEDVPDCPGITTRQVRYLIALTDASHNKCVGAILCPGSKLGEHFVYVGEKSFKCQRSIPMSFFDKFDGKSVYNPQFP
jgi:hypothetical protein